MSRDESYQGFRTGLKCGERGEAEGAGTPAFRSTWDPVSYEQRSVWPWPQPISMSARRWPGGPTTASRRRYLISDEPPPREAGKGQLQITSLGSEGVAGRCTEETMTPEKSEAQEPVTFRDPYSSRKQKLCLSRASVQMDGPGSDTGCTGTSCHPEPCTLVLKLG